MLVITSWDLSDNLVSISMAFSIGSFSKDSLYTTPLYRRWVIFRLELRDVHAPLPCASLNIQQFLGFEFLWIGFIYRDYTLGKLPICFKNATLRGEFDPNTSLKLPRSLSIALLILRSMAVTSNGHNLTNYISDAASSSVNMRNIIGLGFSSETASWDKRTIHISS